MGESQALEREEGDFPYELTAHARWVIAEREIRLEWITRVLDQPTYTEPDATDPALYHALARIPEFGDRVLRVVYNEQLQPWRIVTAYFDRKAKKRL